MDNQSVLQAVSCGHATFFTIPSASFHESCLNLQFTSYNPTGKLAEAMREFEISDDQTTGEKNRETENWRWWKQ